MQAKEERNYHIFYCVLAGLGNDERNKLKLTKAGDYHYLNKVNDHVFEIELKLIVEYAEM